MISSKGSWEMRSLFGKKSVPNRVNIIVSDKTAQEAGFDIKEIVAKEVDECIETMTKYMPQVKWNTEVIHRNFSSPNSLTLIARHEGAIVGVINGIASHNPIPPPAIGLMVIFDPTSEQLGLGGYLVDSFISSVQNRNPKAPYVDVSLPSIDTGLIALYSLKGFRVEGFVKNGFNQPVAGQENQDLVILRRHIPTTESTNVV
jgi:hypothetical protein